jgi:hypothetical protein
MVLVAVACLGLTAFGGHAPADDKWEDRVGFPFGGENGPAPDSLGGVGTRDAGGLTVLVVAADKDRTKFCVSFAVKEDEGRKVEDFRVVVTDAAGKNHEAKAESKVSGGGKGVLVVTVVSEFTIQSKSIKSLVVQQRGGAAPAEDLVLDGKRLNDVSAAPGTSIKKSGEGVAIVTVKDDGKYTVSMDGPGTMYLIGTDDYSSVEVISKAGDGDLVWVPPMNPHAARVGPTVKGKIDGKGKVRMGTQKEVNDLRSK